MRANPSKFQYIVFGKSNITNRIETNDECVICPSLIMILKMSYCDLRARPHIQLLYVWQKAILEDVNKAYHSICPANVNELLEGVQNMYGTRNKHNIVQIKCRTLNDGINSFTYEGAKRWNKLKQYF